MAPGRLLVASAVLGLRLAFRHDFYNGSTAPIEDAMPILVRNIPLALEDSEELLLPAVALRLKVPVEAIRSYSIIRRALDARRGRRSEGGIRFSYHLEVALDEPRQRTKERLERFRRRDVLWFDPPSPVRIEAGRETLAVRPVVVGFGPAGMFAALRLAERGYEPIVLERGRDVRRRHRDVLQRFYKQGEFDPESNLLFGEGGAGTYSDGKLYTRVQDPLCGEVLESLYRHGADPDILVDARPHIGSDRLPTICARIRKTIESLGGSVRFESRLTDVQLSEGGLRSIGIDEELTPAGPTILAMGHSARDTIRMLARRGVRIDPKPFQLGVRMEHPQSLVDRWQYGLAAGHSRLAPAEYHCVAKGAAAEGDMFSFCMCPGGLILPTNESAGLIATNGASQARRGSPYANSGLVITLDPSEMGLSACEALGYLEALERRAFESTGNSYRVPMQRAGDYLKRRGSEGSADTSYPLGGQWTDIAGLMPREVTSALDRALVMLDKKYPGFAGEDAVVTAPETRASSPVRIVRDPVTREAVHAAGLYPVGEGAGYAGGIISAAVDGIKSADAVIGRFAALR